MTELAQALVGGILIGGLYVAISIGFSLSFGVLDVVDLAVGMWVVLGAFAAVVASDKLGVDAFALLPVVFVAFGVVGWLIAPLIYRVRTSKYALPALMGLAFTFGLATLIRGGLLTMFGYTPRTVHTDLISGNVELLGITAPAIRVAGFAFAVVATGLFLAFLFYTRTGLAIRATAQSKENAGLMGVDVKRISSLVYAIYTGLTAMAGALLGAIYAMTPEVGLRYTLFAFFVVVLAGLGSVFGVMAAGLFLGVLQSLVTAYVGADYIAGGLRGAVRRAAPVPARHLAAGARHEQARLRRQRGTQPRRAGPRRRYAVSVADNDDAVLRPRSHRRRDVGRNRVVLERDLRLRRLYQLRSCGFLRHRRIHHGDPDAGQPRLELLGDPSRRRRGRRRRCRAGRLADAAAEGRVLRHRDLGAGRGDT